MTRFVGALAVVVFMGLGVAELVECHPAGGCLLLLAGVLSWWVVEEGIT